jgi:Ca-activated chloride channel homolog
MILAYGPRDPMAPTTVVDWRALFSQLWVRSNGDLSEVLQDLEEIVRKYGLAGEGRGFDDVLDDLEKLGLIKRQVGQILPTPGSKSAVRDSIFDLVFGGLERGLPGGHASPRAGAGRSPERQPHTRAWQNGDDVRDLDWGASLRNTLRRGTGAGGLEEGDLEVWESESTTGCATVLMIDVSHSMILYGEDRITPAKMVAIGLAEFIRRRHPRDTLDVLAFGNEAWRIPITSLAELAVGPFHTNTADGLRLAREFLRKRRASNKRILMITDGKPSCIFDKGRLYKNSMGLDPLVVERTLAEGRRCLREGCGISTFMIAQDPALVEFVELFTRAVHGQAFFTGLDHLGEFVLRDWNAKRSRRT